MTSRAEEIVVAVQFLHDLNKTPEFIGHQLDISPAAVKGILRTGRLPAIQKTLFDSQPQMERQSDR